MTTFAVLMELVPPVMANAFAQLGLASIPDVAFYWKSEQPIKDDVLASGWLVDEAESAASVWRIARSHVEGEAFPNFLAVRVLFLAAKAARANAANSSAAPRQTLPPPKRRAISFDRRGELGWNYGGLAPEAVEVHAGGLHACRHVRLTMDRMG